MHCPLNIPFDSHIIIILFLIKIRGKKRAFKNRTVQKEQNLICDIFTVNLVWRSNFQAKWPQRSIHFLCFHGDELTRWHGNTGASQQII